MLVGAVIIHSNVFVLHRSAVRLIASDSYMYSSIEMCDGKSAVCSIFKPGKGPEWFGEIGKILGNPDDVKKWTDTHLENG